VRTVGACTTIATSSRVMEKSSPPIRTSELERPQREEARAAEKIAARVEAHRRWIGEDDGDNEAACRGID
jgi:hypothetical protein